MKDVDLELEGTWDEIKRSMPDFDGKRLRVTVRVAEPAQATISSTIDEALARIWHTVPEASWQRFPDDFGDNLDHYLYGTPKTA